MPIEFKLPPLGASLEEVSLVRWLVKPGDDVAAGAVVAEAETDKALVDIECPHAGRVGRIVVAEGTAGVRIGSTIALILAPGEQLGDSATPPDAGAPPPGAAASPPVAAPMAAAVAPASAAASVTQLAGDVGRVFASPLARRLAADAGLALSSIQGSGPSGRIVRCDVDAAIARQTAKPSQATEAKAPQGTASVATAEVAQREFDEIAHTAMRRTIALRLSEAKRSIPHFYLTIDCDIDALLALRRSLNETLADEKVSVNDFIVKAVALAMRKVPAANASWTETAIRRWRRCDVSVAVSTPGGLITPVVRDADTKSIGSVAREIRALAERARAGRLLPGEYQGGGFTVSNLGMHGILQFAAIVNPPQSCILAVGAGEQRPVVRAGQLAVATLMTCTLSVDHRVVDGAVGAEFLAVFRQAIEQPMRLLA